MTFDRDKAIGDDFYGVTPEPSAEADAAWHCSGCDGTVDIGVLQMRDRCPGLSRPATPPLDVERLRAALDWALGTLDVIVDEKSIGNPRYIEERSKARAALANPTPE